MKAHKKNKGAFTFLISSAATVSCATPLIINETTNRNDSSESEVSSTFTSTSSDEVKAIPVSYLDIREGKVYGIKSDVTIDESYNTLGIYATDEEGTPITHISDRAFLNGRGLPSSVKNLLFTGSNLVYIGQESFRNCKFNNEIIFPMSVVTIYTYAFKGCDEITGGIKIPNRTTYLGNGVFDGCTSLNGELYLGNHLQNIGYECFQLTGLIGEVNIPDSVTNIGVDCFWGCPNLIFNKIGEYEYSFAGPSYNQWLVNVPKEIVGAAPEIDPNTYGLVNAVFQKQYSLTSVILPDSIENGGTSTFIDNRALKDVKLSESMTEIRYGMFWGSGIEEITIPDSVISIGNQAFTETLLLKEIHWGANVQSIEEGAFKDSGIEALVLPDSIKTVGWLSFASCHNLKSIIVNSNIWRIMSSAFECNENLSYVEFTNVTISYSDDEEGLQVWPDLFRKCPSLEQIYIHADADLVRWNIAKITCFCSIDLVKKS